jgi:hypothetical protein
MLGSRTNAREVGGAVEEGRNGIPIKVRGILADTPE